MNDRVAVTKYINLAERAGQPKQLQKAKDNAEKLALSRKMSMAVVEIDKVHYQVWSVAKVGREHVYIAEYNGGADNDKG